MSSVESTLMGTYVLHERTFPCQGTAVRGNTDGDSCPQGDVLAVTVAPVPAPAPRHRVPGWRFLEVAAFALLVAAVVVLALRNGSSSHSGLQGSGVAATQARSVPPFTSVDLAGGASVDVTVSATRSVVVHADDNLLAHVTTRVVGGRLLVGTRGSFATKTPLRVAVTLPALRALALSGGAVLTAAGVHEHALAVTLSGGGLLRVTGAVDRLDVLLSGGGDAELAGLAARTAHVRLTGSGLVDVQPVVSLDATVSGSGAVVYRGNPQRVTSHVTGSGAITSG
jgi:hypothetical protein